MSERIDAVQAMQDHIEQHLQEEITLADLARVSHFSPWYAHRLFKLLTGVAPADYIRKLRLSRSALRLKTEGVRVIDAALDAGFSSAEGYARAFNREFGCNPGDYARRPVPIPLFFPYGVKYADKREATEMEKVQNVFVREVKKPARLAVVKRGIKASEYFEYCDEVGCDIWGVLMSMDSLCGEPVCLWLPEAYRKPDTSTYVQGVERPLGDVGAVPEGFDVIELPETTFLEFQGEPFCEEDYANAIQQVWAAIDRFDPSRLGYVWDESSPRIQLEPRGERGYIELRPVKHC